MKSCTWSMMFRYTLSLQFFSVYHMNWCVAVKYSPCHDWPALLTSHMDDPMSSCWIKFWAFSSAYLNCKLDSSANFFYLFFFSLFSRSVLATVTTHIVFNIFKTYNWWILRWDATDKYRIWVWSSWWWPVYQTLEMAILLKNPSVQAPVTKIQTKLVKLIDHLRQVVSYFLASLLQDKTDQ